MPGVPALGTADKRNLDRGVRVAITNPIVGVDGQQVEVMGDKYGRQVMAMGAPVDLVTDSGTPVSITDAAEHTFITAGGAGVFLDLTAIIIANGSSSNVVVSVRDATAGTVRLIFAVPANATQGVSLTRPRYQTTNNNNWTATVSPGATTVYVWGQVEQRV